MLFLTDEPIGRCWPRQSFLFELILLFSANIMCDKPGMGIMHIGLLVLIRHVDTFVPLDLLRKEYV